MPRLDEAFRVLAHAHPRWNLTADAVHTWAALLSDIDSDALFAAAVELSRTSKHPPTIEEWRSRALALAGAGTVATTTTAEGWAEIVRNRGLLASQRYETRPGRARAAEWSSEAVRLAAESIGWRDDWTGESRTAKHAQFRDALREQLEKRAAADGARRALEFAPSVERLIAGPVLRRLEGAVPA